MSNTDKNKANVPSDAEMQKEIKEIQEASAQTAQEITRTVDNIRKTQN